MERSDQLSDTMRKMLLVANGILLAIGNCGSPLIMRLYFIHGGSRLWLTTWLGTIGFPIITIPLAISYFNRRKTEGPNNTKLILMKRPVFTSAALLGILLDLSNYLIAFGISRLPVSTATLIIATQLVFNALSAFFLVKQKFTAYSVNAIMLLTVGAAMLALRAGTDRPEGEANKSYVLGFLMTVLGSVCGGVMMPLVELAYKKAKQTMTYTLVIEFQMVMSCSATIFATIGMLINNDFKAIPREAREFQLGETKYYLVLVSNAIISQFYNWGAIGVIFCASALVTGILVTVLLPVSEVLAVVFYHDKFKAEKGVALVLCLWGFVSYFYGEIKSAYTKQDQIQEQEMTAPNDDAP